MPPSIFDNGPNQAQFDPLLSKLSYLSPYPPVCENTNTNSNANANKSGDAQIQLPNQRKQGNIADLKTLPELRSIPWRAGQEQPADLPPSFAFRRERQTAMLLATRGTIARSPCALCRRGAGKFALCVAMDDYYLGSCANCLFNSHAKRCTLRDQSDPPPPKDQRSAPRPKSPAREVIVQDSTSAQRGSSVEFDQFLFDGKREKRVAATKAEVAISKSFPGPYIISEEEIIYREEDVSKYLEMCPGATQNSDDYESGRVERETSLTLEPTKSPESTRSETPREVVFLSSKSPQNPYRRDYKGKERDSKRRGLISDVGQDSEDFRTGAIRSEHSIRRHHRPERRERLLSEPNSSRVAKRQRQGKTPYQLPSVHQKRQEDGQEARRPRNIRGEISDYDINTNDSESHSSRLPSPIPISHSATREPQKRQSDISRGHNGHDVNWSSFRGNLNFNHSAIEQPRVSSSRVEASASSALIPLIDTLPRAKQKQVFGLLSGIEGGMTHLQKQFNDLKNLLGVSDDD